MMEVVKFKLKLRRGRPEYIRVLIFPDRTSMHAFRRAQNAVSPGLRRIGRDRFEAQATVWIAVRKVKGRLRQMKNRGQVLFHSGYLGAGVVAHEMTHIALYSVAQRRRGCTYRLTKPMDERLATMVGYLCIGFWRNYWRNEKRITRSSTR
jgi:hypothetical protein